MLELELELKLELLELLKELEEEKAAKERDWNSSLPDESIIWLSDLKVKRSHCEVSNLPYPAIYWAVLSTLIG